MAAKELQMLWEGGEAGDRSQVKRRARGAQRPYLHKEVIGISTVWREPFNN